MVVGAAAASERPYVIPIMLLQVTIVALVMLAIAVAINLLTSRSFAPYARRSDATEEWVRHFPKAAPQDVTDFLRVFVDGFAISRRHLRKFRPDDLVMDVHRALNPPEWTSGDFAERECLAILLKRRYGIALESIWRDGLTLGEVFAATRSG
jgi:hypothetical protein